MFTSKILNELFENKDIEQNHIGCSDSEVYKIINLNNQRNGYLKIDKTEKQFGVNHEYEVLNFLKGNFPVADLYYYEYPCLLTYELEGVPAFQAVNKNDAIVIIAKALKKLHQIDISNCKILSELKTVKDYENNDLVFVHGDACLPNFILNKEKLEGIIDLGSAGIGDRYEDLALVTWSILYNFEDFQFVNLFFDVYGKEYFNLEKIIHFLEMQEMNLEEIKPYLNK